METSKLKATAKRELALFLGLLFVGYVLMPILIYKVGQLVFGEFGGAGYSDFFGNLSEKIRSGNLVAWFLVLSPWIGWQCLRLTGMAWRATRTNTP
ncbi:MAG: hypothetical protein AAFN50_03070 [Pseudomonadota bacterium]